MIKDPEISEKLLQDYFILQEDIKDISPLATLEAFNLKTFDAETKLNMSAKVRFYLGTTLSLVSLIFFIDYAVLAVEYFHTENQPPELEIKERLSDVSFRFSTLVSSLFLLVSGCCGFLAFKAYNSFKGNEKSRLLAKAHHLGLSQQIYSAVEIILKERIPVYTVHNGLAHEFPIHTALKSRKSAMLVLLGDESHRNALWKDGPIPKGPILIDRKYWKQILGGLEQSIQAYEEANKDGRDSRVLVTALLNQDHMYACYDVMRSKTFWKNKRMSEPRKIRIAIVKILLDDWGTWEEFRKNIKVNLISAHDKNHKFHSFSEKLLNTNNRNKAAIIDILTGKDRTTIWFFWCLYAISEQEMVKRKTPVK